MTNSTQEPTTNQLLKQEELVSSSQAMPEEWVGDIFDKNLVGKPMSFEEMESRLRVVCDEIKREHIKLVALAKSQEREATGLPLKNYYRVAQQLRKMARDKFMKVDEHSSGYYEAITDMEQYFGVAESLQEEGEHE